MKRRVALLAVAAAAVAAHESTQSTADDCLTRRTAGRFTGTFRVRFAGWGTYMLVARRVPASYVETAAV